MKTIACMRDLEQFGIYPLTGEADNLSYRILCDLDMRGYRLLCEVFGMPYQTPSGNNHLGHPLWREFPDGIQRFPHPPGWAANWNSGSDEHPHVASIMLSEHAIGQIAPIGLLILGGCHTVLETVPTLKAVQSGFRPHPPSWVGLEATDSYEPRPYDWDSGKYTGPARLTRDGSEFDWPDCYGQVVRTIKGSNHPSRGTRNVHAMSGRAV